MTKREAMERTRQDDNLRSLGFTQEEAVTLRRISMTLHSWFERECGTDNGCIERDEITGKPRWLTNQGRWWAIPDRETGAKKRLEAIMQRHQPLLHYIQSDPRGAALYILTPEQAKGYPLDSIYTRGLCIY